MIRPATRTLTVAGAVLLLALTQAGMAQDIQAGEKLAQTWCAGCHQVGPNPRSANDAVPPFAAVAAAKGMTQTALTVFLSTPHGKMPDYSLSRQQIRDVSAYIMSLKR